MPETKTEKRAKGPDVPGGDVPGRVTSESGAGSVLDRINEIQPEPGQDAGEKDAHDAGSAPGRRTGDEIRRMFGVGTERALAHVNRLAAEHYMFAAVDDGTSDYMSIRDSEADDGRYKWRDSIAHESIDMDGLLKLRDEARRQLPLAIEALRHAGQAIALEPDSEDSMFRLERTLEEVVDAAGTLMVVHREIGAREHDAVAHGE